MHKNYHRRALLSASMQLDDLLRRLVAILKDLCRATQRQEAKQGLRVASRQSNGGDRHGTIKPMSMPIAEGPLCAQGN
jgi:hypothetical protein